MCNKGWKVINCECGGVLQPLKSVPPAFKCTKCNVVKTIKE